MRQVFLLLFLLLISFVLFSQEYQDEQDIRNRRLVEKRSALMVKRTAFFQFNLNVAEPLGSYGSDNVEDKNFEDILRMPLAKLGIDLNISFSTFINKYLGIIGTGGYFRNDSKHDIFSGSLLIAGPDTLRLLKLSPRVHHHLYVTGGMIFTYAFSEKVAIDVNAQIGISYGIESEMKYEIQGNPSLRLVDWGKANDIAFMPNLGAAIRFNITTHFSLSINLSYKFAKYEFRTTETTTVPGTLPQSFTFKNTSVTHIGTAGIGLIYRL